MHTHTSLFCSHKGESEGVSSSVTIACLCLSLLPACLVLMSSAVTLLSLSARVLYVEVFVYTLYYVYTDTKMYSVNALYFYHE